MRDIRRAVVIISHAGETFQAANGGLSRASSSYADEAGYSLV